MQLEGTWAEPPSPPATNDYYDNVGAAKRFVPVAAADRKIDVWHLTARHSSLLDYSQSKSNRPIIVTRARVQFPNVAIVDIFVSDACDGTEKELDPDEPFD